MKRNKRKTFAYRPSDKIISRESIVSVILGAAGIIGYYLLLFGFHKDRRNKQSIKWSWRMDLAGSISYRIIFGNTK